MTNQATEGDPDSTLTVAEVAARLQLSIRQVRRLANRHEIAGVFRIGKCVRFHQRTFVTWLDGQANSRA